MSNAFVFICLFSASCCRFVETIYKMKLNTISTKYKDLLLFNLGHIINGAQCHLKVNYKIDLWQTLLLSLHRTTK